MYREHEFDKNDRCIHCCSSRASILTNSWPCNQIESDIANSSGKRDEIKWDYTNLVHFLKNVPAINDDIHTDAHIDNNWYIVFRIDITNDNAWNVVQILGSIINSMHNCGNFKPISPSVDLNGGPLNHLSWVIESLSTEFTPEMCYVCLHNNMPQPVNDLSQWDWE